MNTQTNHDEPSRSPFCSTVFDCDIRTTLAELSVAEHALREEPYERLPALAWLIAIAASRIAQLKAIVDKLPMTADGVPVVPGMDLFKRSKACHECGRPVAIQRPRVDAVEVRGIVRRHGQNGGWVETAGDLYSTREAAEGNR